MKHFFLVVILTIIASACTNEKVQTTDTYTNEKSQPYENQALTEKQEAGDTIFRHLADFPEIKDTTQFIADLLRVFKLQFDESHTRREDESINTFKKVKIYGSKEDYFLIEYDYKNGVGAAYPWKYQLLLTAQGKLVKALEGERFELLEIFNNENPFLLVTIVSYHGNGGHEIYKFSNDTLENVYEGYFDYAIQTYDDGGGHKIYEPSELTVQIKDYNNDGFNDIAFVGKIVYIMGVSKDGFWFDSQIINGKSITYSVDNPFKKVPVKFVFLYDKKSGHFKAKEDYVKKYSIYD